MRYTGSLTGITAEDRRFHAGNPSAHFEAGLKKTHSRTHAVCRERDASFSVPKKLAPATFSAWSAPLSSPGKYRRCARWPRAALDLLAPAGHFTPGATALRADASLCACRGLGQSPKALCRSIFASVRRAQETRLSPKSGVIQRSGPLPFPGSGRFFTGFPYREFCAEERFSLPRSGRPRSGR